MLSTHEYLRLCGGTINRQSAARASKERKTGASRAPAPTSIGRWRAALAHSLDSVVVLSLTLAADYYSIGLFDFKFYFASHV